jgi:hypothetical protein
MHSPARSPSLRALAGDVIERLGGIRPLRACASLAPAVLFVLVWGYAVGDATEFSTSAGWRAACATPAWMLTILFWGSFALPRSRLVTALPLGRRVLFDTQVMRNIIAAIVAIVLFEGFDLLSETLAPHLPVLSGARFVPVGYSAHLAATVASIGLAPPLLRGRAGRLMAESCFGVTCLALQWYVVDPGPLAGSALCATTWGFGLIVLGDRYRRGSLV